jgi:hypothetical protein
MPRCVFEARARAQRQLRHHEGGPRGGVHGHVRNAGRALRQVPRGRHRHRPSYRHATGQRPWLVSTEAVSFQVVHTRSRAATTRAPAK